MSKVTKPGAKTKDDKGPELITEKKFPFNITINLGDCMRPVTDSMHVAAKLIDYVFDNFDTELLKRQVEG
jgi:hypothetical protein